jgi:uncharacterized protein YecE (DUF72 family)
VLFQTPPDFALTDETLQRLEGFLGLLPRRPRSVFEFRNKSWFDDRGLDLLRRHGVAFCIHDSRGLECPVVTTSDLAYVRFHGGPTHDGNYSHQALEDWAGRICRLIDEGATEVWLYFNNDVNAYAIDNARTLGELMSTPSA